jgi:hypothetical protein
MLSGKLLQSQIYKLEFDETELIRVERLWNS